MSDEDRAKALFFAGLDCVDAGDNAGAEARFREALALVPERGSILANLAAVVLRQGRPNEARTLAARALALSGENAAALAALATAEHALGHLDPALAAFDRLVGLTADDAGIWAERGDVLAALARWDAALHSYDRALSLNPDFVAVHANRGNVLKQLGRLEEALVSYDRALALKPDFVDALANRGVTLQVLRRPEEALATCEQALSLRPDHPDVLATRGIALNDLKQTDAALASLDHALDLRPDYPEALNGRGVVLLEMKRRQEGLASLDRALALRPDYADAMQNRGIALKQMRRLEEALASFERVLALQPGHAHALSDAADCVLHLCDWDRLPEFAHAVVEHVRERKSVISPFVFLAYSGDPALQLRCAQTHIAHEIPTRPPALWRGARWRNQPIRVAYLSADFHRHATAYLMAELFELHDRDRFEIVGISFGPDDDSDMRRRLLASFDSFHDMRGDGDAAVARRIHDLGVDIAVDLKGYTEDSRPAVLAHRPAPIQVAYLGYPATMAVDFIDYVVADAYTVPFSDRPFFTEKIVHLPDSYQVNDRHRQIAKRTPSRAECGLPEKGFVFCCFNNTWKITPEIFDVWTRLLAEVPGSVLWLLGGSAAQERNVRHAAQARGLHAARLVFAPRQPLATHLARHRLADLFLDTLPYNAHTTTSDALWAGLPVLTCQGSAFAGRVATSLLHAVGLPEMVTTTLADYEALALSLARDPARLAEVKAKLARNRDTAPLFDTARFTRHIEAAYTTMWERWQHGEPPAPFAVSAIATAP